MSQANAIVVLCPKRPDLAGQPLLGHVGWGFELPDGQWMVGAVEGDGWANGNGMNGFWSRKVPGEKQATQVFANMVHYGAEYNYFKYLTMTSQVWPDPDAALRVMAWVSAQIWTGLRPGLDWPSPGLDWAKPGFGLGQAHPKLQST